MQNLNRLWQVVNAAQVITDLARHKQTYTFPARHDITFYLRAETAAVRVVRWERAQVEVTLELTPAMGWRFASDYDDAGVYVALRRRGLLSGLARAGVAVFVPFGAHLVLRLEGGMVQQDFVYGVLEVAPPRLDDGPPRLPRGTTRPGR